MSQAEGFWDSVWNDDSNREFWTQVGPEIVDLIGSQSPDCRPDVLDLGCGLGRNAIAFARAGFHVTATDLSPKGIAHLEEWAGRLDLPIRTLVCSFDEDVFSPESFDIVVSFNVLYHGYPEQVARAVDNVRRWLKCGGVFYFTFPTRDDGSYGRGRELAAHTFELEPGHMHGHMDEADLDRLLAGFRVLSRTRRDHRWEKGGEQQCSSRWRVLVEKI